MLYSEIIAVCSQIHTKHINTLCGVGSLALSLARICNGLVTPSLVAERVCGLPKASVCVRCSYWYML